MNIGESEPKQRHDDLMSHLRRRPLVGMALVFVAGTCAGLNLKLDTVTLCEITATLAAGALVLKRPAIARVVLMHGLLFAGAWLNAAIQTPNPAGILSASFKPNSQVEILGVVYDEPVSVDTKAGKPAWRFPLRAEACRRPTEPRWHAAEETVSFQWFPGKTKRTPKYGEEWLFHARITAPPPGLPNRPAPPATTASANGGRFLQAGRGDPLTAKCLQGRAEAARILSIGITDYPDAVETLNSLLLGYRSQMPQDAYRAYAATGTIHIFAIDGFHVVVQAAVIIFVLGACRIPRTRWIFFLAPMLILYTVMTGLPPSALRACIMAIIFWSAPLFGRRSDVYTALAASAILILAVVPSDLMSLGFILSFVVVLGIVLLYPVFARPMQKFFAPDPLRLQPESRWVRLLRAVWRYLSALIATSCAAWLVSAPLTAYYFQMFSLIAIVGNLVAMPLASLMIVTGALSLVFGSCIEWFADVFNHANLALAFLLTRSMEFFAAITGGNFPVDPPPMWLILLFYFVLAVAVMRFRTSITNVAAASGDATEWDPEVPQNRRDGARLPH